MITLLIGKNEPLEIQHMLRCCSIKILKLLLQSGQLNASEIARAIGINYGAAFQHLRLLVSAGILLEKRFGRTRQYRISEQSPRARAVLTLLQTWYAHYSLKLF